MLVHADELQQRHLRGPRKSTMNPNMEDTTHPNSSAYSSLTNSNGDVRNAEDVEYSNSAEEIRRIADDYNQTLKKAEY